MSRIFLSHSSRDNFEAVALGDWLASVGWDDVFLDFNPDRGIAAGERWERALHAAATRCQAVVFLVSRNWLKSDWCVKEYALARGLDKRSGCSAPTREPRAAFSPDGARVVTASRTRRRASGIRRRLKRSPCSMATTLTSVARRFRLTARACHCHRHPGL